MNRWKWQTIRETSKALIAKGQYAYAFLLVAIALTVPILLSVLGLVGSYYGVKSGLGLLR